MDKKRDSWSGNLTFILAGLGSAVGLGNIWRFSYMAGSNGGGSFVLIYLLAILCIGLPVMVSEIYIGQKSQKNTVTAFQALLGKPNFWQIIGILSIITVLTILTFYSVVGGWVLQYLIYTLSSRLPEISENSQEFFSNLLQSPINGVVWTAIFTLITGLIVVRGIKSGIEKVSKILMPLLFFLILVLFIWSLFLPGIKESLLYLLKPDFSKISSESILAAIGQAFFSLSLGMGTFITYGSYLKQDKPIGRTSLWIATGDTLVAIIMGIIVFSVIFSFGFAPNSGPGLIFETLPTLFNKMPGGCIISVLFFFLVLFAAVTSSISILETAVTFFSEITRFTRKQVTIFWTIVLGILACICSLSFNSLSHIKVFSKFSVFDFADFLSNIIFLPVGGILITLFFGWVLGKHHIFDALKTKNNLIKYLLLWSTRVIAPIAILLVLINGIYACFK